MASQAVLVVEKWLAGPKICKSVKKDFFKLGYRENVTITKKVCLIPTQFSPG